MYFRNTEKATLQHLLGREKANFIIIQNKNKEHGGLAIDTYHYFTTYFFMTNQYKKARIKRLMFCIYFQYQMRNI